MEELYVGFGLLVTLLLGVFLVYQWLQKPSKAKLEDIKEWLVFATLEAEKALGTGTGELKLRYVYDKFLTRFGAVAKFISFEQFQDLVEEALLESRRLLLVNSDIEDVILYDVRGVL